MHGRLVRSSSTNRRRGAIHSLMDGRRVRSLSCGAGGGRRGRLGRSDSSPPIQSENPFRKVKSILQFSLHGDQLNMDVFFRYLGKSDLSSVNMYGSIHWTSNFLQGTRITRPYLNGHPVTKLFLCILKYKLILSYILYIDI